MRPTTFDISAWADPRERRRRLECADRVEARLSGKLLQQLNQQPAWKRRRIGWGILAQLNDIDRRKFLTDLADPPKHRRLTWQLPWATRRVAALVILTLGAGMATMHIARAWWESAVTYFAWWLK